MACCGVYMDLSTLRRVQLADGESIALVGCTHSSRDRPPLVHTALADRAVTLGRSSFKVGRPVGVLG